MKTRIPPVLITFALACFALVQNTQAVSPAPDGGYPGYNTAEGDNALLHLTTGIENTANGFAALEFNTTGRFNTAIGFRALYYNTTGGSNTAIGFEALASNTTGNANTATGYGALFSNTTGFSNTANGVNALFSNTTGHHNTANGYKALFSNINGNHNTANGEGALGNNTHGLYNTALGAFAGQNVISAQNVICIGAVGADVTGSCFIGQIRDVTTQNADAIPVVIDSAGQLGTASSSRRFKNEIKPMDQTSEAILALKPVTFHYKSDKTNTPQFGLIAEEVAAVNPDLVVRDKNGEIYTVRYDQVNAMLLNEFLKEHCKVEELEKQVKKLTAGLQKVSAQVEASKPASQLVNNP